MDNRDFKKVEIESKVGDHFEYIENDNYIYLDINWNYTEEMRKSISEIIKNNLVLEEDRLESFLIDIIESNIPDKVNDLLNKSSEVEKKRAIIKKYLENGFELDGENISEKLNDSEGSAYNFFKASQIILNDILKNEFYNDVHWLRNQIYSLEFVDVDTLISKVEDVIGEKIEDREKFAFEVLNVLYLIKDKIENNDSYDSMYKRSVLIDIDDVKKLNFDINYRSIISAEVEELVYDNFMSVLDGKSKLFNDGKIFLNIINKYLTHKVEDFTFSVNEFLEFVDYVDDFAISKETLEMFVSHTNENVEEKILKFCSMCLRECEDVLSASDVLNALTMKWFNKTYEDYYRIVNSRLNKGILPEDGSFSDYLSQANDDVAFEDIHFDEEIDYGRKI